MATSITHPRGADRIYTVTITDSNGTAIDITGYTVFFKVKEEFDTDETDANAVISKVITSHSDPTSGITTFSITDTDSDLEPKRYYYELRYKDTSDLIAAGDDAVGNFIISPAIINSNS